MQIINGFNNEHKLEYKVDGQEWKGYFDPPLHNDFIKSKEKKPVLTNKEVAKRIADLKCELWSEQKLRWEIAKTIEINSQNKKRVARRKARMYVLLGMAVWVALFVWIVL